MRHKVVATANVRAVMAAQRSNSARAAGQPGIDVIWAPTGWGKSWAMTWLAVQSGAVHVRALRAWTPCEMLRDICHELSIVPRNRCVPMIRDAVATLSATGRTLIVDEADYLARRGELLETLRDIHDLSTAPLILVGMEEFKASLMRYPQIAGRVAHWIEFQDNSIQDAQLVADERCEVKVGADLLRELHRQSGGSMRRLAAGLQQIELVARRAGKGALALPDWGDREFDFAEAPARRRRSIAPAAEDNASPLRPVAAR